jgi:exopolyphosphatase/guanosine-5'-triphosphate,3'-diphosphate pyrophosphatase
LSPAAIARTNGCLDEYARIIHEHGVARVAVVGTSAMRDAGGGEEVRAHVRAKLGVEARVISGDEEARLTFLGALSGLRKSGRACVFDIGGGSTEVVIGEAPPFELATSIDIGSVRLTERHVKSDPPGDAELDRVRAAAKAALSSLPRLGGAVVPVGIAGTVTTLAAVALGMEPYDGARVHGHEMALDELRTVVDGLAKLDLARRRTVRGLEPKRADVIVAGGLIAIALLEQLGSDRVVISDRGVRWGLAIALTSLNEAERH